MLKEVIQLPQVLGHMLKVIVQELEEDIHTQKVIEM
jgi:hypothetical protein